MLFLEVGKSGKFEQMFGEMEWISDVSDDEKTIGGPYLSFPRAIMVF